MTAGASLSFHLPRQSLEYSWAICRTSSMVKEQDDDLVDAIANSGEITHLGAFMTSF